MANKYNYKPRPGAMTVPGLSHIKIFDAAQAVREYIKSLTGRDLVKNHLPILFDHLSTDKNLPIYYSVVDDNKLPSNVEAITNGNSIKIKQSVWDAVENSSHPYHRRYRFTLCHEIGHAILHSEVDHGFARMSEPTAPFESSEWQADTFSGYLLVSLEDVKYSNFCSLSLSNICNISKPAASKIIKNYRNSIMR